MNVQSQVEKKQYRIRSFVRRDGRRTPAQERAWEQLKPQYGLELSAGQVNFDDLFQRQTDTYLEIGFGSGQSLLAIAKHRPDINFIGVETHKPGVGALFLGMQQHELTNLRVYNVDVVDVLTQCIPDNSLAGVQIFFPDPWQKRRHHQRRLIQPEFLKLLIAKLKPKGELHLATDWEHYALHMMRVVSAEPELENLAGVGNFAERSPLRPIVTKFERRAEREGRKVYELRLVASPAKIHRSHNR